MSIVVDIEIARIIQAKDEIAQAIETKGVTVEIGDLLSDYANLIMQISQGIPSNYGLVTYTAVIPTEAEIKVS